MQSGSRTLPFKQILSGSSPDTFATCYSSTMPFKNEVERVERQKVYARRCYLKNRDKRIAESAPQKRRMVQAAQAHVLEILSRSKCLDCGESNPVVLEFDHREPELKRLGVSQMILSGYSLQVRELSPTSHCQAEGMVPTEIVESRWHLQF
jgi:hypothetical protein